MAAGLGLAGWSLAIGLSPANAVVTHQDLADLARNLGSGLFLVAGVLCLASWRLTADPPAARRAVALLVLGAGVPGAAAIGPLLGEPARSGTARRAPARCSCRGRRPAAARPAVVAPDAPPALSRCAISASSAGRSARPRGPPCCCAARLPAAALPSAWRVIVLPALLAWLLLAFRRRATHARAAARPGVRRCAAFLLLAAAELIRLIAMDGTGAVVGDRPGLPARARPASWCCAVPPTCARRTGARRSARPT